jgi:hypothetical protein
MGKRERVGDIVLIEVEKVAEWISAPSFFMEHVC